MPVCLTMSGAVLNDRGIDPIQQSISPPKKIAAPNAKAS